MADAGTLTSLGAAVVSAGGALWAFWSARRLERDKAEGAERLKRLEAQLGAEGRLQDSRTRYEWDARRRLFEEVEPVMFLTGEVMEMTFARVANMAQAAAGGRLGPGDASWLRGPDNYYLLTSVFRVLRPLACLRMMTEKLTRLDFSLDARVQAAYVLGKMYRDVLSGPFDLAAQAPVRRYAYVAPEPSRPYVVKDEAVQHMQHLYTDELEAVVDTLLVRDAEGRLSLKRYGMFRAELLDPAHETARLMAPALLLFRRAGPANRPVLWRALLACGLIAKISLDVLTERSGAPGAGRTLGGRLEAALREPWLAELRAGATDAALDAELEACVRGLRERLEGNRVVHLRLA